MDAVDSYTVSSTDIGRDAYDWIWSALIDSVSGVLSIARLDIFPNPSWSTFNTLPPSAQSAATKLCNIALSVVNKERRWSKRSRAPFIDFELPLRNQENLDLVKLFGPYSIFVGIYDLNNTEILASYDEGLCMTISVLPVYITSDINRVLSTVSANREDDID